jgi:hypothetical protein
MGRRGHYQRGSTFVLQGSWRQGNTGRTGRAPHLSPTPKAVKHIEGIGSVVNNIEVLPLSPMDDNCAEPSTGASRDGAAVRFLAVPSIHIIVKMETSRCGVVDNELIELMNLAPTRLQCFFW